MSARGFIAVSCGILEHPVVGAEKPYRQIEAWIWLLLEAAYKVRRVRVSNGRAVNIIELNRGQLSHSQSFLAKAWGWSEKRVRTFLGRLEKEGQIALQTDGLQTVITICNYGEYQFLASPMDGQSDAQPDGQRARKGREEEQGKKGTKKNPRQPMPEPDGFSEFYAAYPRKEARKAAAQAFEKVVPTEISAQVLLEYTKQFARKWADRPKHEHKFCPLAATWLNGARFIEEICSESLIQTEQHLPSRSPSKVTETEWLNRLQLWEESGSWPQTIWGPPPGQPGCCVPINVLNRIATPKVLAVSSIKKRCAA